MEKEQFPKRERDPDWWRDIPSRLALPMLAGGAAWGVYAFNSDLHFVPQWVAALIAGSFELTYVGLSVVKNLPEESRIRARRIAQGAVGVSIIYNVVSGMAARYPAFLNESYSWATNWPRFLFELLLATIHGLPLALVAFLVADLLMHSLDKKEEVIAAAPVRSTEFENQVIHQFDQLGVALNSMAQRLTTIEATTSRQGTTIGEMGRDLTKVMTEQQQAQSAPHSQTAPVRPVLRLVDLPDFAPDETSAVVVPPTAFSTAPHTAPHFSADGGGDEELEAHQGNRSAVMLVAEPQSETAKQDEALRLYEELGTYAAVAKVMGYSSDRTVSKLVAKAKARREQQGS